MSRDAVAEWRPARRTSKIITRLSFDADAMRYGLCGAQVTESTAAVCPGKAWVASPDRRSSSRTALSDVPTPIRRSDDGCDDKECEYGVE